MSVTVKPIRTEADFDEAIARINALLDLNPTSGTPEDDELDVLSTLVESLHQHLKIPLEIFFATL